MSIEEAIKMAMIAADKGEVPVGAVIIKNNIIIARSHNLKETLKDCTAHAELLAIKAAQEYIGDWRLNDCILYSTLEPCPMCAHAISLFRINNLYYGADDPKGGGIKYGSKVYDHDTCHHKPNIYSGIYKEESSLLLKGFFKKLRLSKS